jgi:hypothetical protein
MLMLSLAGCGDDAEGEPLLGGPGPSYAGSCNLPSAASCSEYADAQADANSAGACASSGGTWSAAQCPVALRFAVCASSPPATRSYAYSMDAATALQGTCAADKYSTIEQETAGAGGEGGAGGYSGTGGTGGAAGSAGAEEDAGI